MRKGEALTDRGTDGRPIQGVYITEYMRKRRRARRGFPCLRS